MLIPLEPRAGPTGGEGFAAPPLICSLINPATSLAIFFVNIKLLIYKEDNVRNHVILPLKPA
jgi:hypothetical protein